MSAAPGDGVHDAVSLARLTLGAELATRLVASCRRTVQNWLTLPEVHEESPHGEGTAPTHPAGVADVLRDDAPAEGLTAPAAIAAAPESDGTAFVVPRVADVA